MFSLEKKQFFKNFLTKQPGRASQQLAILPVGEIGRAPAGPFAGKTGKGKLKLYFPQKIG